jgi:tetratricopeptide (TPR) repeat protein
MKQRWPITSAWTNVRERSKSTPCLKRWIWAAILSFGILPSPYSHAEEDLSDPNLSCPLLRHGHGPLDYRTATDEDKRLVEGSHFVPDVENLKHGAKHPARGYVMDPGSEIDYTLRSFPNHPRALLALTRLSFRDQSDQPGGTKARVSCYFSSAIKFRPDDAIVRVLFGAYLIKKHKSDKAIEQFEKAKELGGESASMWYNLGLAYLEIKRYPEALEAAHKAYALGFPLPGLRDRLKSVNAWKEPAKAATEEAVPEEATKPKD